MNAEEKLKRLKELNDEMIDIINDVCPTDAREAIVKEDVIMVPDEMDLRYDMDGAGDIVIGNGSQCLAWYDDGGIWCVWGYDVTYRPKNKFKLIKTTFGELEIGDVLYDELNYDYASLSNVINYGIKTRKDAYHYWSVDERNTEVCSVSEIKEDREVYKVVPLED